ncbi:MAG: DUF4351 domain-containing protein [Alcanivorax sp.]|nr:DUF4351 domain-containing protein [Alcanivorax sp.]
MTPWLLSVWRQPVTTTEASQQDDYDSPWKEAIEIMLADFMAFYFPDAWQAIDWQQPHRFLDQELQKIVPESGTGRRVVDKLVEVALVQGGDQWIHLHIEIQSSRESDFAERMMIYHYRIFDRFRRPVASLAVLADHQPGWRPRDYRQSVLGCHWTLEFPSVKLLDYRLIRLLYGQRREKHRIIQLLRVIDWLMALPPHLEQRLGQRLTAIEGEKHMQYVTSFERLAKQDGVQQGTVELLIRQLTHRFGPLPDEVRPRLERATPAEIETLADRILEANSLEQVFEQN